MVGKENSATLCMSSVVRHFFAYMSGAGALKFFVLVQRPIAMFFLAPEQLGLYSLINTCTLCATLVCSFGLQEVFRVYYYRLSVDLWKELAADLIVLHVLSMIFFACIVFIFHNRFNTFLFAGNGTWAILCFVALSISLTFFNDLYYQVLTCRFSSLRLVGLQVGGACLYCTCSLYFLLHGYGFYGLLCAKGISVCALAGVSLIAFFSEGIFKQCDLRRALCRFFDYCSLGLSLIAANFSGIITSMIAKLLLIHFHSLHAVGLFSIVSIIGNALQVLIMTPCNRAYMPWLFRSFSQEPFELVCKRNWNVMWWAMAAFFVFCLILYGGLLFCGTMLPVFYQGALVWTIYVFLAYSFLLGASFASAPLHYANRRGWLSFLMIVFLLANLVFGSVLIKLFGFSGACMSFLCASLFYFLICVAVKRHIF